MTTAMNETSGGAACAVGHPASAGERAFAGAHTAGKGFVAAASSGR